MSKKTKSLLGTLAVLAIIVGANFAADWFSPESAVSSTEAPAPQPQTAPAAGVEDDYFTVTGAAQREYDAVAGQVDYCPTDELQRAVCAYGELTFDLRQAAQQSGRQSINFDPVGWNDNQEVHIAALPGMDNSTAYNGWFWNRSHLLADSLGGDATRENMVTGTRTQNVGSTTVSGEFAGGMAHTEVIARDYVSSEAANTCPLYYAATPNYEGDELVPRTVTVDIQSCDLSIDERVLVSNTAQGWDIDYATGVYSEAR